MEKVRLLYLRDKVVFVSVLGRPIPVKKLSDYLEKKYGKIYNACMVETDHYEVEEELTKSYGLDWELLKSILLKAKEEVLIDINNRFNPKYHNAYEK